jgi:hypothetical protein
LSATLQHCYYSQQKGKSVLKFAEACPSEKRHSAENVLPHGCYCKWLHKEKCYREY